MSNCMLRSFAFTAGTHAFVLEDIARQYGSVMLVHLLSLQVNS